jgi:ferritin
MPSSKVAARINEQINKEMYSAYLYMAMSARMTDWGYKGAAKWLMVQYHEEMFHAMKFFNYLQDAGAMPEVRAIAAPALKESNFKEMFVHVLEHEKGVTASIRELLELATAEKDYATENLVRWYVDEQVEEERNASEILQNIDLLGNNPQGLFMLNIELGKRDLSVASNFTELGGE